MPEETNQTSTDPLEGLPRQQRAIIELLLEGRSTLEMARDLGLSVRTVEEHRRQAFMRLGIKRAREVVAVITKRQIGDLAAENQRLREGLLLLQKDLDELRVIVDRLCGLG